MVPRNAWISILLFLSLLVGCQGEPEAVDQRPLVVASIHPVGDLIRILADDLVRVDVLLPAGASPATFDLTPRRLSELENGALFFMIGGGLDEWVTPLAQGGSGGSSIVRLSQGIPLLDGGGHGHEGSGNPHVWLDPVLVRDFFIPKLTEALSGVASGMEAPLELRADLLADSLTKLDAEIRETLAPLDHRSFLSTHAAWTYFAARYGLEEAGVIHSHAGQDPSSREMAHLMEEAQTHEIDCLFTEPQLGEVAARALAIELSLPTCMLDPLGGPEVEGREGYFELLRFNTAQFVQGLGRGSN